GDHAIADRAAFPPFHFQADAGQLVGDLVIRERHRTELAQPAQRDLHSCSRKRTSFSKRVRRSSRPCRSIASRSIPTPKAYPVICSGSKSTPASTSGFTIPAPSTSSQPVPLHSLQPFP